MVVYEILGGDFEGLDDEVISVNLGSFYHTIYIRGVEVKKVLTYRPYGERKDRHEINTHSKHAR